MFDVEVHGSRATAIEIEAAFRAKAGFEYRADASSGQTVDCHVREPIGGSRLDVASVDAILQLVRGGLPTGVGRSLADSRRVDPVSGRQQPRAVGEADRPRDHGTRRSEVRVRSRVRLRRVTARLTRAPLLLGSPAPFHFAAFDVKSSTVGSRSWVAGGRSPPATATPRRGRRLLLHRADQPT